MRHYTDHTLRSGAIDPHPDVDTLEIQLANGAGRHAARNVVGGDFLHLVRLGIRGPQDPVIIDSIKVIDEVIRASCRKAMLEALQPRCLWSEG